MRTYRRILVPVDGSPTATKALVAALQIARDGGGSVRLVHALDDLAYITGFEYGSDVLGAARTGGQRLLDEALAIAKSAGVESDTLLVETAGQRLGETIAQEAREWKADLIVVGTHGRRGVERMLLGSGAEHVIRLAPVPVLVIRGGDK